MGRAHWAVNYSSPAPHRVRAHLFDEIPRGDDHRRRGNSRNLSRFGTSVSLRNSRATTCVAPLRDSAPAFAAPNQMRREKMGF
jgi:hypothetical protein